MTHLERIALLAEEQVKKSDKDRSEHLIILALLAVVVIAVGVISILRFNLQNSLIIILSEFAIFGAYLLFQLFKQRKAEERNVLLMECILLCREKDAKPDTIAYFFELKHDRLNSVQDCQLKNAILEYLREVLQERFDAGNTRTLADWNEMYPQTINLLNIT